MTPTDVFATLVNVVAGSLDDPDTTGADLARRAYCRGTTSTTRNLLPSLRRTR